LYVVESGKVGIGTTSPASKLTINATDGDYTTGLTFDESGTRGIFTDTYDRITFRADSASSWEMSDVYFRSTSSSYGPYIKRGTGTASTPTYVFNSDENTGIYGAGSGYMGFASDGVEVMTITTDDRVQILL
jgi:uncharacterized protein RhaS with RHS repeats